MVVRICQGEFFLLFESLGSVRQVKNDEQVIHFALVVNVLL